MIGSHRISVVISLKKCTSETRWFGWVSLSVHFLHLQLYVSWYTYNIVYNFLPKKITFVFLNGKKSETMLVHTWKIWWIHFVLPFLKMSRARDIYFFSKAKVWFACACSNKMDASQIWHLITQKCSKQTSSTPSPQQNNQDNNNPFKESLVGSIYQGSASDCLAMCISKM